MTHVTRASLPPRIGSLCSGYGGLELGLITVVGGSVAWHVEYDKHPSAVLEARFPGVPNYGDITTTDWTQVEPVDWLTAGYPCQPFSHAGKRKGKDDERHLWPFVADAIGALHPRRVLLENVAGHVSLGLDAVLWDLAALGYDATWGVVRASDAGAPHGRARVFIAAADTRCRSLTGTGTARNGLLLTTEYGSELAADACGQRHGGREDAGAMGRVDGPDAGEARQRERSRPVAGDRSAEAVADTAGAERRGAEREHLAAGPVAAAEPRERAGEVAWGVYEPAIRRWERILGRPAPAPVVVWRERRRLNPYFSEWMMGLPHGWVADVLEADHALKCIGNGVVPQQAALAIRALLLPASEVAA